MPGHVQLSAPADYACRVLPASGRSPGVRGGREAAHVVTDAHVAEQRLLSSRWLEIWQRLLLLGEGPCSSAGGLGRMPSRSGEEHGDRGGDVGAGALPPALVREEEEEEETGTGLPALQAVWRELR